MNRPGNVGGVRLSRGGSLSLCQPVAAERLSAEIANVAVNSVKSPEGPELLAMAAAGRG
jgi:hypothetical protein